ncbi:MAG TPA: ParB/RepB/Spo0J family partition protein [Solirubrobacterales bacterium]|nr:ParB/RepB/Spo0J family partition protein [Solirubrobacterales bacterium]
MSDPSMAVLDIEAIKVENGFNPRTEFDPDKHRELVASIEEHGITQALTVRPHGGTHHIIIDGERRWRAAKDAGVKRVPVLINEGDGALAASLVANLIRADLNPVEEARGFLRLAELEKLGTNKAVAKRVGKSAGYVGDRKRMLKLPEGCLPFFASGAVTMDAERNLRRIAEVSPRIAVCACELAERGEIEAHQMVNGFGDVLYAVSRAKFDDPPTMIDPDSIDLGKLIEDEEKRFQLIAALVDVDPYLAGTRGHVRLGQQEVDNARAAGCLVEVEVDHGSWTSTAMFITDKELAADLAECYVDRKVKAAAEQAQKRLEAAKKAGKPTNDDEKKAARKKQLLETKAAKATAERANEKVGVKLIQRRGAAGRKEHGLNRARAVAAILLFDHDGLAGAGIRLALPQLREVERKTLKSGEHREKIHYADRAACNEYIWKRVQEARSEGEVMEILTEAMIAGSLVDAAAIARSKRIGWFSRGGREAMKFLAAEVKAVRPRRSRAAQ